MRAWQRMLSGRRLDLINPSPVDIEIEDIAHGLARVARWNGQTLGDHAFSVAQHSLIVADIFALLAPGTDARWQLAALLHDASEYVIGDMISPFKNALGLDYRDFEEKLQHAVHIRFGLPPVLPEGIKSLIKQADKASAFLEATQLAGFSVDESHKFFGAPPKDCLEWRVEPTFPDKAKQDFIHKFQILTDRLTRQLCRAANA